MRLLLICITRFYWIFFFSFSPFVFSFVKSCLSFITAQTLSNVASHERNFAHLFFDCVMFKLDCKLAVKPQCLSFFVGFVCHNECTSWTHKRLLLVVYKICRHHGNMASTIQHHALQVSSCSCNTSSTSPLALQLFDPLQYHFNKPFQISLAWSTFNKTTSLKKTSAFI